MRKLEFGKGADHRNHLRDLDLEVWVECKNPRNVRLCTRACASFQTTKLSNGLDVECHDSSSFFRIGEIEEHRLVAADKTVAGRFAQEEK